MSKVQQGHRHCKLGVKIILTIKKGGQRISKWKTLIFLFRKDDANDFYLLLYQVLYFLFCLVGAKFRQTQQTYSKQTIFFFNNILRPVASHIIIPNQIFLTSAECKI